MNEEVNYMLNYIKLAENQIINNIFYNKGKFCSGYINNYYNTENINYYDIVSILKFYFFVIKNIQTIEFLLDYSKKINYDSYILNYELDNLNYDYNIISKYKNDLIINMTFNKSEKDTDTDILKQLNLLNYCNPKYIDDVLEYLPEE